MISRLLISVLLLTAGPALAAQPTGVLYDCDITQKRDRLFWIADKIAIVVKDDGEVVVFDQVILRFNEAPLTARVTRNNDRRMVLRWTLRNVVNGANQLTTAFDYTATLTKSNNRIAVYASPEGYSDRFSGKGTCTKRTE
ncbi:MAG: hypothetical protein AB8B47_10470 [Roseobacter sp.]